MKTILIVDDIPENLKLLKNILQNDGYRVLVSTSGQKALEIVEKSDSKPDLILLDIMMPEMDGYEVCKLLKANEETKSIPIIFATAKGEIESEAYGLEIGAVDYINKPISAPILLARVKTHIRLNDLIIDLSAKVKEETAIRMHHEKTLIAQSKHAAMGEMIDAIAHQWKQPLTIMQMDSDVMGMNYFRETIDEAYIKKYSDKFRQQIRHLNNTIDQFRTFFKPTSGDERFNLKDAIESTISLIKGDIHKNSIDIELNMIDDAIIDGNVNEFKHIVINLINNSKDAFNENNISTENRSVILTLQKDEKSVKLLVEDNAGGIPEGIIGTIFNPRVTTKETGTGVGLYLSSQIAEKLGSTLSVCNKNNGCEFCFEKKLI